MARNEDEGVKGLIKTIQNSDNASEKEECMMTILKMFEPFRRSLAGKFAGKGVEFDDVCQVIDLKLIEAMFDYDENLDSSAIRHITSKARNGIFNFYKKEMYYFKEERKALSLESLTVTTEDGRKLPQLETFGILDETYSEDDIIDKIIIEQGLENLTEHQKDLIHMYFMADMTQKEIAEELQIHQTNVSRATKRGVKKLKESLSPLDERYDKR